MVNVTEVLVCSMVKEGNKRVMLTFTPKTMSKAEELMQLYDMTLSQLVKMLISEKSGERRQG